MDVVYRVWSVDGSRQKVILHDMRICAAIISLALTSCINTAERLDEFIEQVPTKPDAPPIVCDEVGPDLTGDFLVGLQLLGQAATPALFQAAITSDGTTMNMTFTPLDECLSQGGCTDMQPVTRTAPLDTFAGQCTQFNFDLQGIIPHESNPLRGEGGDADADVVGSATTVEADFFCGTANGTAVIAGTNIAVSDWGFAAVRITDVNSPPAFQTACPTE